MLRGFVVVGIVGGRAGGRCHRTAGGGAVADVDYCWYCYQPNDHDAGDCDVCGHPVLPPVGTPAADVELWALSHPELDRRIVAIRWLGDHRDTCAVRALRQFAEDPGLEPELAAAAAWVLTELTGSGRNNGLRPVHRL